jgi:hypothetical protein
MKKKSQAVAKAFTPEETSLIENMVAIGNQLLTMSEGGEVAGPETEEPENVELEKFLGKMEGQPGEEREDEPEEVEKADDELDARKPAEDKMDIGTEVNDENLPVTKMMQVLAALASRVQPVKKSQPGLNSITAAVQKAISPIVKKIEAMEQFNENMLDALGITQTVEKTLDEARGKTQTVQKALPVQATDQGALLKELTGIFKSIAKESTGEQNYDNRFGGRGDTGDVRKDLGAAMSFIFKNNINRRQLTDRRGM